MKIASILLILAFGLQSFQKALILVDYRVNTSSYEKNCVNKARPQLKCHGRCQMMKKMRAEEKKDEQAPERKTDKSFDQYCSNTSYSQMFFVSLLASSAKILPTCTGKPVKMPRQLLRPPSC